MAVVTFQEYFSRVDPNSGELRPLVNVWIRLMPTAGGPGFVSDAATDSAGRTSFTNANQGVAYTVESSPTGANPGAVIGAGGWTGTGDTGFYAPGGAPGSGPPGAQGPPGADGAPGIPGAPGQGVPAGGAAGQLLSKVNAVDYNTQWIAPPAGGGGMVNPMTTPGDIIKGGAAGAPERLGIGGDGQVLTVDPVTHLLAWKTPAAPITGGGGDQAWIPLAYQNGWVDYGAPYGAGAYRKDALGFVHLQGLVKNGGAGTVIATLPAGYRPAATVYATALDGSNVAHYVLIGADGTILTAAGASNANVALDDITFYAGPPTAVGLSLANEDQATILTGAVSPGDAGGRDDHFPGGALDGKWTREGAVPAFVGVGKSVLAVQTHLTVWSQAFTPNGAFRVWTRVNIKDINSYGVLMISDASVYGGAGPVGNAVIAFADGRLFTWDAGVQTYRVTAPGPATPVAIWYYTAIERDGADNWKTSYSIDGEHWHITAAYNKVLAVAKLKIGIPGIGGADSYAAYDLVSVSA
jgi:hypothetical protein